MSKDFRLTEFRILIEMNENKFNFSTKYPTRKFRTINKTYFSSLMKKKKRFSYDFSYYLYLCALFEKKKKVKFFYKYVIIHNHVLIF